MALKYYSRNQKTASFFLILFAIATSISCKKLVDVKEPNNRLLKETVFNNDLTAISVLNQIFSFIHYSSYYGVGGIPIHTGLSVDELNVISQGPGSSQIMTSYYQNNLNANTISTTNMWADAYTNIFTINDAIEGISTSSFLTPRVKQQLIGEAKFMRAFCYFYLVNIYGEVPLILSTDYTKNSLASRTSIEAVYQSIISDLGDSYSLLSDNFLDGRLSGITPERVRPTKWAAAAMLSRIYLYTKQWKLAEDMSSILIDQSTLFSLDSLSGVFLRNSKESILQFQPTGLNANTWYAQFFVMPDSSGASVYQPTFLTDNLLNSFEAGDLRKEKWVGYSITPTGIKYAYPSKYKAYKFIKSDESLTEYYVILRLAEQYLIRSEARAQQNNLDGALKDLKTIRTRAGLSGSAAQTKSEILDEISHERQVELFLEWGDRWFDLKRTGRIDAIMSIVSLQKGGNWKNYKQFYPIETTELIRNPNLKQTIGY